MARLEPSEIYERSTPGAPYRPHPVWTVLRFGVTLAAFVVGPALALLSTVPPEPLRGVLVFAGMAVYSILATALHPQRDAGYLDWLKGQFNNALRAPKHLFELVSYLFILVAPGRFLGTSVVEMYRLVAGARDP
jgi:hypothetical protein